MITRPTVEVGRAAGVLSPGLRIVQSCDDAGLFHRLFFRQNNTNLRHEINPPLENGGGRIDRLQAE